MKTGKKWIAAVCAVGISVALFGGCSFVTVNEERDNRQVVATVNGEQIYKEEYNRLAPNILSQYGMTMADVESRDDPEMYKQSIIDSLVEQVLVYNYAVEQGKVDLSEEHIAELTEEENNSLDEVYNIYLEQGKENGEADPEAYAQKQLDQYIEDINYIGVDGAVLQQIRNDAITVVYEEVTGDVKYTEEQAKEYYDEQVDMQKDFVEDDPSTYEMYKSFGTAYVNPAGSKYVKNLLISIPDDKQTEISSLRSSGEEEEADAMLEEELAKILPDAEAALKRAQGGEDFDALIEELGSDSGMEQEPAKTYGYLVIEGGTDYVQSFQDAAMALENEGDISGLVQSDYGYHIIKYQADGSGPVPFEMMKDDIISSQEQSLKTEKYTEFVNGLKEQADIITYVDRV